VVDASQQDETGDAMSRANSEVLRSMLAANPDLWRFGLLTALQLGQFTREHGLLLWHDAVESLWQSGLLRCDVLIADHAVASPSFELVCEKNGRFQYCDMSHVVQRPEGFGGIFKANETVEVPGQLLFHPFRVFVLYHIVRVFRFAPMSTQYLQHPNGLAKLSRTHVEILDKMTSTTRFAERLEYWNAVAELAVALEPISYGQVFLGDCLLPNHIKADLAVTEDAYGKTAAEVLSQIGVEEIENARSELIRAAELLDPNKLVHVLLRLTAKHERLKLRGQLGGSMLLLCMAELVRRATERVLETKLPEEDELGFGQWMDRARALLYGTERILDAPPETQRDFLTSMGLDRGTKARCYVEGPTELGALRSAVGEGAGIRFTNLRGQVSAKRGKGLGFADELESDRRSNVFSVVVLDGDRQDNVRALKKAAEDGRFFGVFCISSPDFEFANFKAEELLDVWLEFVSRDPRESPVKPADDASIKRVRSPDQFIKYLREHDLPPLEKSEAWGEALMAYALKGERLPEGHTEAGEIRPIVRVARNLMTARRAGYERSVAQYRVDPETGRLVDRGP